MNTNQGVSIGVDLFLDCPHQHLKGTVLLDESNICVVLK